MDMKRIALVAAGLVVACMADAEVIRTWTGAAGNGSATDPANWDAFFTGEGQTARFTNSADVVILEQWGASKCPGKFLITKGNVTLNNIREAESDRWMRMTSASPTIEVAEGATFSCTNSFDYWSSGSFRKKGKGLFTMCGYISTTSTTWTNIVVEAGKMELVKVDGVSGGTALPRIFVKSGAEFGFVGNPDKYSENTVVDLETNAILRLNGFSKTMANLSGEGSVVAEGATSTLTLSLVRTGNTPFSGTFSGNMYVQFTAAADADDGPRFVVQREDQFADIKSVRYPSALVFRKGLGQVDFVPDGSSAGILRLEDDEGGPFNLRVHALDATKLTLKGRGDFTFLGDPDSTDSVDFHGPNLKYAGKFGIGPGAKATFGNSSANNDVDLTSSGTLTGVEIEADGKLTFAQAAATVVDVPVAGGGSIDITRSTVTFNDFRKDSTPLIHYYVPVTFAGGEGNVYKFRAQGATRANPSTFCGARIYNGESTGPNTIGVLPTPDGIDTVAMYGQNQAIEVTAGELAWASGNGLALLYLRGGRTYFTQSNPDMDPTDPRVVFDGGEAVVDLKKDETFKFLKKATGLAAEVTSKGGRLTVINGRASGIVQFVAPTIPSSSEESGELSFYGCASWLVSAPFSVKGPVAFRDGRIMLSPAALTASNHKALGLGELRLSNAELSYYWDWDKGAGVLPGNLELTSLGYAGAASVRFRYYEGGSGTFALQNVQAESLRRTGKGSVLFLCEDASRVGADGYSTFKVSGGLENSATGGFVKEPIVVASGNDVSFARYDEDRGIVLLPDSWRVEDDFAAAEGKVLNLKKTSTLAEGQDVSVGGVKQGTYGDIWLGTTTLAAGSRLRIGDGTNPALFMFAIGGKLAGSGTVDFGTSEGVFVSIGRDNDAPHQIPCTLAGSGGVSYVGCGPIAAERRFRVSGNNTYTGGTYVNGCSVRAASANAFSSGDVYVGSGEYRGGRVRFDTADTFANAFHAGGWGSTDSYQSESPSSTNEGCIAFHANATIAGSVELLDTARIYVRPGCEGTISGVVSGKRLQTFTSEGGILRLTNSNVYDGGTEIIQSTLAVTKADGVGTGEVVLNGGTIRFENPTASVFTNDIRGIGMVQMAGAEVKFTGDRHRLTAGLDVPGTSLTLTETPPFPSITNSTARVAKLTLSAPGRYVLDPAAFGGKFNLTLATGAVLDLGGGTLTVRRFEGDPEAVNGTIVETNPKAGALILLR